MLLSLLAVGPASSPATSSATDATSDRIRELLKRSPLVDGHNDVPEQYRERVKNQLDRIDLEKDTTKLSPPMHTDVARLRAGGVGGQFWSVYVSVELAGAQAVQATLEQIDIAKRLVARSPQTFEMAYTAGEVERIHAAGRIGSLIGLEGGHSINNSLGVLREMYRAGARYMTLTHWTHTDWADAATQPPRHHGLTAFGELVVKEMNRLGMLVDLSHVSEETMSRVLAIARAPVIFSHSSARAICSHPRNVPDAILDRLPANGGVVMVNFAPSFVSEEVWRHEAALEAETARLKALILADPEAVREALQAWKSAHPEPRARLEQVADHIDHLRSRAGVDHVGLGSDFDGISSVPVGLEDVSRYPDLLAELARRGYSDDEIRKIAGLNVLRALKQAEQAAARLQRETAASDARIEDIDKE